MAPELKGNQTWREVGRRRQRTQAEVAGTTQARRHLPSLSACAPSGLPDGGSADDAAPGAGGGLAAVGGGVGGVVAAGAGLAHRDAGPVCRERARRAAGAGGLPGALAV